MNLSFDDRFYVFTRRACEPPMPGLVSVGCLLIFLALIAWTH